MIWSSVATAIVARLASDATLLALLTADSDSVKIGTEEMLPRTEAQYPYVSIGMDDNPESDGFNINGTTFDFTVKVQALSSGGVVALTDIVKRIYGDGSRSPAYGLHRWAPGTIDGWNAPVCWRTGGYHDSDAHHYTYVERYRLDVTKAS